MRKNDKLLTQISMNRLLPEVDYRSKTGVGIECIDLSSFYKRAEHISPSPFQANRIHFHCFLVPRYSGTHVVDFRTIHFDPNTIVYIGPGQVHAWAHSSDADGHLVLMTDEWFRQIRTLLQTDQSWYWRHNNVLEFGRPDLMKMLTELLLKESPLHIQSHTLMLLAAHWMSFLTSNGSDAHSLRDIERLTRLQALVETHMKEERSVAFYANLLGLTSDALSDFIKRMTGVTAKVWINQMMLLEAKRMLVTENISISLLAQSLGFTETTHFIRFFRRYSGFTPFEFRRSYLNSGF